MKDSQKLEALMQKAVEGGFYSFADGAFEDPEFIVLPKDKLGHLRVHVEGWPNDYQSAEAIIFSHDFARALFGDKKVAPGHEQMTTESENWFNQEGYAQYDGYWYDYHRIQAVTSGDPIDYMYKAVFNK